MSGVSVIYAMAVPLQIPSAKISADHERARPNEIGKSGSVSEIVMERDLAALDLAALIRPSGWINDPP